MKKLYLLFIPFLIMGCNPTQKIAYKTNDYIPISNPIPISFCVKELVDIRKDDPQNSSLFRNGRQTKDKKKTVCINSEKHYKENTVAAQVSQQIAEHIGKMNLFRKTTFKNDPQADLYMTGKLSLFNGMQGFSTAAAVGSGFGLVGALITSGAKTQGDIVIEIKDIAFYDKNGNLVKEIGDYRREFSGEFPADGHCWCIYGNMNSKFEEFNKGLVKKIHAELIDVVK